MYTNLWKKGYDHMQNIYKYMKFYNNRDTRVFSSTEILENERSLYGRTFSVWSFSATTYVPLNLTRGVGHAGM